MALIVHKYGGSSVADADKILNVARRIGQAKDSGMDVVAVVSAMGDTTDELISLAQSITAQPDPRELDLLAVDRRTGFLHVGDDGSSDTGLPSHQLVRRSSGNTDRHNLRQRPDLSRGNRPGEERVGGGQVGGLLPASKARQKTWTSQPWAGEARTRPRWRWLPRWGPTDATSTPMSKASTPQTPAWFPRPASWMR